MSHAEAPAPRVAGLVLAAGAGRRFGGPKQLAPLDGRPLLEHALAAMEAARLPRVAVTLGAHADAILAAVDLHGATPVVVEAWAEGQAASLRAGVAALAPHADAIVVTLGDQPLIGPDAIARVAALAGRAGAPGGGVGGGGAGSGPAPGGAGGGGAGSGAANGPAPGGGGGGAGSGPAPGGAANGPAPGGAGGGGAAAPVRAARATWGGAVGHPVLLTRPLFGAVAALRGDAGARELLDGAVAVECGPATVLDVDTPADLRALGGG